MAQAMKAADLFDVDSAKKAAKAQEEYLGELNKALSAPINPGTGAALPNPIAEMEALVANKSLSADAVSALNTALAAQRGVMGDVVKDISLTSPLSTSFAAFDLEAPAKLLTPRPTPLRNMIARKKGVGTAHRIKKITGYTGTGTGGQGQIWPGITESTTNTFGSIAYERGPKISYTAEDAIFPYFSFSLSDSVSFDANYSALGYQDLRQLSSTSTLYASMLMEERMLLMSRGTASGLSGALAAPSTVTLGQRAAANGEVALSATTYYVYTTSDAGAFGESVSSTVQSLAVTSGNVLTVTVNNVAGSLGTKVYIGTTTGNANAKYQGRFTSLTGVVNGAGGLSTNDNIIYSTTSTTTAPTADSSAYATGYDGIIPQILAGGSVNEVNAQFSTSNPGAEFQTIFGSLYDSVKADPDLILLNGSDRKQLSDAIKNGSTANYRLNLEADERGGYVGGAVISGLHNEVTGKLVDLLVHPWLPQGVAPVISKTLPIPDTEVSDVWAVVNVQDYQGIQWPVTQFSYDFSTYWRGTLVGYAPAWNGIVTGIKSA
jgi:hypothetical protein